MRSLDEVRNLASIHQKKVNSLPTLMVGMGTCGKAAGGDQVWSALSKEIGDHNLEVNLVAAGCIGMCYAEPLVEVRIPGQPGLIYGNVAPEDAVWMIRDHLQRGTPLLNRVLAQQPYIGTSPLPGVPLLEETPFYSKQTRNVLRRCGQIDPDLIEDYLNTDGYTALETILSGLTPLDVIQVIKSSGLRGRGGGGFPAGRKWEAAYQAKSDHKYVVCNADEGDPGAFMDRSVLEGDPHSLIEGMLICAYAIGADEGYIYVRAEYPLAIKRLKKAITDAENLGLLGDNILDSGFSFKLHIVQGAGAFVCGEETALLASIEGQRGMPRPRPPYPAESGLWGCPTNINNVETYANVASIINRGPSWYRELGTDQSGGTKVFALTGKVNRTGLAEVPIGISLREIVYDIAGGVQNDRIFKAVQIGGPSGGCIPIQHLDTPVDYQALLGLGAMMGSGGLVVMDEQTCMVDVARYFLAFTQEESCGKCAPCREGTRRMLDILERICSGYGRPEDIALLEDLGETIKSTSLCGLGQSAPNPVLATLKYFRHEYDEHIRDKRCSAGVCTALQSFMIESSRCKGCTLCIEVCPTAAISGEKKKPHMIDEDKCIRCGACVSKCKFEAIHRIGSV